MNIREAFLKAADHFEANPHLFDFYETTVPECGTPGCMVGWVGFFLGRAAGTQAWVVDNGCLNIIGIDTDEFLSRRSDYIREGHIHPSRDAASAAMFMRWYAAKYHPAESITVSSELERIFAACRERVAA